MIAKSWLSRCWQWQIGGCAAIFGTLCVGVSDRVLAQILPDNTLGAEGSVVTPNVSIQGIQGDRIDGGATRGANLFHSFQDFNVGEGRGVYFANPTGTENILTRVTGSNASNILGRLGVLGGANLFLLNPNGIVFGSNASLDIQGSFLATTAERIQLGDSGYFSAAQPQMSSLLSVSPGALFFSQVANQPSSIINQGNLSTGKHLTLRAGNLDLQGQLLSGGDLTLQAQDTVKVRDAIASPFIATSGRNLTIQGNQNIDILALKHPLSKIGSGGNLNLISDGDISGDARFESGGSLSMLTLSGTPANFVSWFDPIIQANGDVLFGDYTGVALKVEATGSIQGGNILITGAECAAGSAGCVGGIPTTEPDFATLTGRPSVILRAGLASVNTPNLPQNAGGTGFTATSGLPLGISVGNIYTSSRNGGNGGDIILKAANGSINTGDLKSSSYSNSGNAGQGGAIRLTAANDINITGDLESHSQSSSGDGGQGGAIRLTAANDINITGNLRAAAYGSNGGQGGAIRLTAGNDINITSFLSSSSTGGNRGQGGAIRLTAANGSITTGSLYSDSQSYGDYVDAGQGGAIGLTAANDIFIKGHLVSSSSSGSGNAGQGGAIGLTAANDIFIEGDLDSSSESDSGTAGQGGAISLTATNGSIITRDLNSWSASYPFDAYVSSASVGNGGAGQGGAISLTATNGSIITRDLDSGSLSDFGNAGQGGAIGLTAANGSITTRDLYSYSRSNSGNAGQGGAIALTAANDIHTGSLSSYSYSESGKAGQGGAIGLTAANDIHITGSLRSYSSSRSGNAGQGGAIDLTAANDIFIKGDLYSYSYSQPGTAGEGGAISLIARSGDIVGIPFEIKRYDDVKQELVTEVRSSPVLGSFSISEQASAGNGGNVALEAKNNVSNLEILTLSSDSQSGAVQVRGLGDLLLTDTNILTRKRVTVPIGFGLFITLNVGGEGQSGPVDVTSSGNLTFKNSSIQSDTQGSDNAGNVTVNSPGLVTFNNSSIRSNTSSTGAAGSIRIEAGQGITLVGSNSELSALFAGTTNQGEAGNITLTTPELTLQNGAKIATTTASSSPAGAITLQSHPNGENLNINLAPETSISASTSNQGNGGNITITGPDSVTIQGQGTITTSTTGTGNAGNIILDTSTLTIARGAQLFGLTEGSGNSGTIKVNASTAVNLGIGVDDFSPVLSVETSNAGKAGSIIINTPSLTLSDTARITATATSTATNTEGGGSITLNASTMDLAGVVGVFAETQGQTPAGTLTLRPYENQSTLNLTLAPQSQVSASTSGSGKGGNLIVQAPEAITIQGPGQLAVQTTGDGAAGNLSIDTQKLTISDGATISASTSSANPDGVGGNLTINATESFNLTNQARLLAQSTGAAPAGNITIHTGKLTTNNGSIETSATQSAGGGITITASDIRLFGDSDIRTDVASGAGGGGNINLTANSIIAFGDSDILAYADRNDGGRGGNITLDTRAFFGENYRPASRRTDPRTLDRNNRVDINATGAVEGVITIPDVSFIQNSLTELPSNQINTDSLLANSCIVRRNQPSRGSFIITGTGGLPQRPGDTQMSSFPTVDVETLPSDSTPTNTNPNHPWQKGDPIVEPQGVYRLPNGKLVMSRECS
jgi:filamentous hemagglutinin family protein